MRQLAFTSIMEESFRAHERKFLAYMETQAPIYRKFARDITPEKRDYESAFARIAFAILSANAPFDDSVKALQIVLRKPGKVKPEELAPLKMVPAKAKYCNRAYRRIVVKKTWKPAREASESWHAFRLRAKELDGLGLTKASFAVGLLAPLDADVACLDTWMQKVFLGHTGFRDLSVDCYLTVENKLRSYAQAQGVSTFLCQWMIWDHARKETNSHCIFPGTHKDRGITL